MKKKKRVVIGLSGGVDSSVSAALLKKQGFEVIGIFMKLWAEDLPGQSVRENVCCSVEASTAARAVAEKLSIPFYVVNFEEEFKHSVVDYYVKEYEAGRTPNPCVICNRDIKSEILLRKAGELGAEYLATGHYGQIKKGWKKYRFFQGKDKNKDQTYFLWMLTQEKLAHVLFPVGNLTKPEVRKLALKFGLPTATRRESQGICFIPDGNVASFLKRHAKKLLEPGLIFDIKGNNLGTHDGLIHYTIGQRQGLGLGGPEAYYVVKLDSQNNTLIVGEDKDLFSSELVATDLNWINKPKKKEIGARIRYGHPIDQCQIEFEGADVKVKFAKPQRAITPGQSIVFYQGQEVLGGGIIKN